jgi:hypothetical protein
VHDVCQLPKHLCHDIYTGHTCQLVFRRAFSPSSSILRTTSNHSIPSHLSPYSSDPLGLPQLTPTPFRPTLLARTHVPIQPNICIPSSRKCTPSLPVRGHDRASPRDLNFSPCILACTPRACGRPGRVGILITYIHPTRLVYLLMFPSSSNEVASLGGYESALS